MTPLRGFRWIAALLVVGGAAVPADAAWDNVFQVCCFGCRNRQPAATSFYAPQAAACCPQPQQVCCTQYVQRAFYQPVTCYQTKTYYEPVTTMRTSYYWEPVTTYRYSCKWDPCTCSWQQVACPTTCYQLRSQCNAVTSYLQRTCQVPVTSYRLSYYYEPVTSCYNPCAQAAPAAVAPAVGEQVAPQQPPQQQPGVNEYRSTPPPASNNTNPGSGSYDRYYPTPNPNTQQPHQPMPPAGNQSGYRPAAPVAQPPQVRLDRIVAVPKADNGVVGQVVRGDNSPQAGAPVTFVSVESRSPRQTVTADQDGRFQVTLAPGGWLIYLSGANGQPVFHSKIEVNQQPQQMLLVSR